MRVRALIVRVRAWRVMGRCAVERPKGKMSKGKNVENKNIENENNTNVDR
jgi:hypothetical protein